MQHITIQYSYLKYSAMQYWAMQYSAMQYSKISLQWNTVHCSNLHSTVYVEEVWIPTLGQIVVIYPIIWPSIQREYRREVE